MKRSPFYSNNDVLRKTPLTDGQPASADVTTSSSSSSSTGRMRLNLSLAVPDLPGKSVPGSPLSNSKRKTSHGKPAESVFSLLLWQLAPIFSRVIIRPNASRE